MPVTASPPPLLLFFSLRSARPYSRRYSDGSAALCLASCSGALYLIRPSAGSSSVSFAAAALPQPADVSISSASSRAMIRFSRLVTPFRQRQIHGEHRAHAVRAVPGLDGAAPVLDGVLHDGQPQSGAAHLTERILSTR